ncbi:hypothetical protein PSQ19_00530 [Devosia algicola]|uniref:Rcc01698-like C-terminal domain-containing protein n=1 Tax=Devosia algicola TaxID=3026418 RepID=A0ABY7YNB4_9HYPH|nr:hypothetical protein [Devosia algicola]WDR02761.1 hypothetical protein PSQ19_00530 [Devosia algicola]
MAPTTVLAGGNRLAVETDAGGWEVIGFANAELVSPQTYELSQLLRGLQGTDAAIGPVAVGRRIIMLDRKTTILPVGGAWLEGDHALRVYGGSADVTGTPLSLTSRREVVLPLAPVHLQALKQPDNNDIVCRWVRRSRADDNGWVAEDAPLVLLPERYRLTISLAGVTRRTIDCDAPEWTYTQADQIADFGSVPEHFEFAIAQIDPVFGPGNLGAGEFYG